MSKWNYDADSFLIRNIFIRFAIKNLYKIFDQFTIFDTRNKAEEMCEREL